MEQRGQCGSLGCGVADLVGVGLDRWPHLAHSKRLSGAGQYRPSQRWQGDRRNVLVVCEGLVTVRSDDVDVDQAARYRYNGGCDNREETYQASPAVSRARPPGGNFPWIRRWFHGVSNSTGPAGAPGGYPAAPDRYAPGLATALSDTAQRRGQYRLVEQHVVNLADDRRRSGSSVPGLGDEAVDHVLRRACRRERGKH